MKKICIVVDSIYNLGGIQRVVVTLVNNLKKDYDIEIICLRTVRTENKVDYGIDDKINVIELDSIQNNFIEYILYFPIKLLRHLVLKIIKSQNSKIRNFFNYKMNLILNMKIKNYFKKKNFDYILAEGLEICIIFSQIKQLKNKKIIGCWHSSFDNYLNNYNIKYIYSSLNKLCKTIVLSKYDVDSIRKKFNIEVDYIYNPLSFKTSNISDLYNRKFIAVGRYNKVKGFDKLIEAFKIFNQNNKTWTLDIVGDGPERNDLQRKINEYKLGDYVNLIGLSNDMDYYYRNSSCLLISSKYEGFSMVLIEAMSYGMPVIAFDLPIFTELLPGDYKYIVKQGNIDDFADKMHEIANNYNLRKKVGCSLNRKIGKFDINIIIDKWKEILK